MPYKVKRSGSGYKVTTPNHPQGFSKKPLPRKRALAQLAAIKANSHEESFTRRLNLILDELLGPDQHR